MLSQSFSDWLQRKNLHYGWIIAALTFLTMLTSSAALGLPGALLQPLSREFGWNADQISSAMAIRFMLYGLIGPFAAIFMQRFGLRKVVCSALLLIAACLILSTQMRELWHLFALWGLTLGVASGMTALVLGTVVASRWFEKRRGLVIGMLTASTATGQLLFLPLAAWLIEQFGWRMAVVPVFIVCAIVCALAYLLLRNQPQDIGLRPYGADPEMPIAPVQPSRLTLLEPLHVLAHVARHRTFWVLAGTFFICGLSTSGLIQTHFISLCGDYGLAAVPAASVLAMMGAFDFVGTILSGWLSDRYDNRKLLFWYYGLRGLSLFWLPHSEFTLYGLSLFALFYGLDWIATVPPTVKLTGSAFGKEQAGMVFGWIFAAHQLGSAVAAYGAGLTRTWLLTYNPALYAAGAACLVAAMVIFLIPRQDRTTQIKADDNQRR
ncbi:MFS transporter [uncultured Oxalicibacterium sp.]|uniref:MFS transporter n=1 Tax=uncultured Oxalicibacterium sp. TaxID=1168540 RepID=UPI0025E522B5|nr:MFS transporter [uncultured Oxalicibacterium sp.]